MKSLAYLKPHWPKIFPVCLTWLYDYKKVLFITIIGVLSCINYIVLITLITLITLLIGVLITITGVLS